jgi:peptide subunit release factor 1 (eRF1)
MVSYEDLDKLRGYVPEGNGYVLSLYLDVDQSKASNLNRGFETVLNNEMRVWNGQLENKARQEFDANRARVSRFIKNYTPKKKSLVIFCDAVRDFWWDRELPILLPSLARFAGTPFVQPLIEALGEYERYGVVLVDKEKARLCTVYLGEIEEHSEVFSELPRKTATTSRDRIRSQDGSKRHHDEHVHWHVKTVAEKLKDIAYRLRVDRLVIGGTTQAVSELLRVLPKALSDRVVGTLPLPVNSQIGEVLAQVKRIEERADQESKLKLIQSLVTAVNKGDRATLGAADTIQAVNEGKVWRLLFVKKFSLPGRRCPACEALYAETRAEACVYCGNLLDAVSNVVGPALERTMTLGGGVEEVHGPAAEKLAQTGSIGAFLRY